MCSSDEAFCSLDCIRVICSVKMSFSSWSSRTCPCIQHDKHTAHRGVRSGGRKRRGAAARFFTDRELSRESFANQPAA